MKKVLIGLFCLTTGVLARDTQHEETDLSAQQFVVTSNSDVEYVKDTSSKHQKEQEDNGSAERMTELELYLSQREVYSPLLPGNRLLRDHGTVPVGDSEDVFAQNRVPIFIVQ